MTHEWPFYDHFQPFYSGKPIMPTTLLLAPQDLQTFLRPWDSHCTYESIHFWEAASWPWVSLAQCTALRWPAQNAYFSADEVFQNKMSSKCLENVRLASFLS